MALTKRAVDGFKFDTSKPTAQQILYDGDLPGFGIRLNPSGAKKFIVRYRVKGQLRLHTIGKYGVLTVDQARTQAKRILAAASEGRDLMVENQSELTVRAFAAEYIERHAKQHKRSWQEDQRRLDNHILPKLGGKALAAVTRAEIARLHGALGGSTKIEANRVLALLSGMFGKAEEWSYLPDGHPNPARKIQKFRESTRDRWVKPDEMPRLLAGIATEPNPFSQTYFLLTLLLGTRKSELLSTQWKDVDLARAEIRFPQTKAGRVHTLPLPKFAVRLLKELPRLLGNPYVFASPRVAGAAVKDVKNEWLRIRDMAELSDVTIHDLRRTCASWLAESGVPLQVIARVLNHADRSVTAVYARLSDRSVREALDGHAERIESLWLSVPSQAISAEA